MGGKRLVKIDATAVRDGQFWYPTVHINTSLVYTGPLNTSYAKALREARDYAIFIRAMGEVRCQ
jgi:hypothetical protein